MQGLAQQQAPQPKMGVQEVVAMLMQGMSPEELVQRGVPPELVKQAMILIQQQQQPRPEESGLAGMVTNGVL